MITARNSGQQEWPDYIFAEARRPQRRNRRKFSVTRTPIAPCRAPSGLSSPAKIIAYEDISLRSSHELPESADDLFAQVAQKVNNKITMDRRIYGGAPCVANTRVPVYAILQMVEEGCSHKRILKAFPSIGKEGLEAALRFSVLVMER